MSLTNPLRAKDSLSLEAVIPTPEFLALNIGQRKFVVRYLSDGLAEGGYDAEAAVRHAYGSHIKHADIRAYQILRNKKVKAVLDMHFRRTGLESILADLKVAARKSARLKGGLTLATRKALAAFEEYVAAKDNTLDVKPTD